MEITNIKICQHIACRKTDKAKKQRKIEQLFLKEIRSLNKALINKLSKNTMVDK